MQGTQLTTAHLAAAVPVPRPIEVDLPLRPTRAGDLRRVHYDTLSRLAYVIHLPSTKHNPEQAARSAVIALVHTYTEYATSSDKVIDPSISGLTYRIVVQSDMVGVVFLDQLDETPIAHVAPSDVANASCGTSTSGPFDARTLFKQNELDELRHLVAACTAWALDHT